VKSFSATLLLEGGGNQLIYGSSHLLKTSMRRRKEVHTRTLARLAGPGEGRGRTTLAWMVRRNPASHLASHDLLLQFWSFGLLSPKRTQLRVLLVIVFHEVGFPDYISRPPSTLKRIKLTTRVLPLLTATPPSPRLQSDHSRAPATERDGLRNRRLCDPAPGEGE
jgi:hypothetical protein